MIARRIVVPLVILFTLASEASAQFRAQLDGPRAGSLELGGGVSWGSSIDFGEQQAQETRNPTTGAEPLDLFVADSTLQASPGGQAYLGYYITRAIAVEGGMRFARPKLRVRLTSDFEDAAAITAEESITQYQFEGSVVMHLTNLMFADENAVPYVIAGAGHVRDLHEGDELIETGNEFHGGGGLKWWFGAGRRRFGLRFEARITSRQGGFDFGEDRRTAPSGAVSLAYLF